ncbi:MAG: alpha/beta fold hydrolase [Candidatus Sumerlaeaceae bacterium]|nr:alpha/beta fold hydrolase [Candidatus Sumerlaeaceae bacterium]
MFNCQEVNTTNKEAVVLLHGIGRTPFDMWPLANALKREGFTTYNWGYPSRHYSIIELADQIRKRLDSLPPAQKLHFVGHSMGGLVARRLLAHSPPANVGRLVMIASPNAGSMVAEKLGEWKLFKKLFGPAGQDLRRGARGVCPMLGLPHCEFAIITGGTGKRWGMNPFLGGDNDGLVTVEEAWLEGAADFLVLPYLHAFLQFFPRTMRNVIHFLRHGHFLDSKRCPLNCPEKPPE